MSSTQQGDALEELEELAHLNARESYWKYLHWVTINASGGPQLFSKIGEEWQWERERTRLAALEDVSGVKVGHTGPRWFWSGCAKGNDKSSGVARRLNWLLGYSKRPLQIYICSGKLEQAALITSAMRAELELNPWLKNRVDVSDYSGHGESGSDLTVMPMQAYTGQGIFPDVLIADELSHWVHDEGRRFWDFILASVPKHDGCYFEVLTNAGFIGSWQWDARKMASSNPKFWSFFEQPPHTTLASWMDPAKIDAISEGMMAGEVKRLLKNQWIDPGDENGYISLADAEACVDPLLEERVKGVPGTQYYAVIDYGGVFDRTAMCVMHAVPGTDRVIVDRMDVWAGSHANRIQLHQEGLNEGDRSVQKWIDVTLTHFPKTTITFDPYQCESLAQIYERRGNRVERFEYKAGKRNFRMAQLLKGMVESRRITWSPRAGVLSGAEDDTIAKELARLILKPTIYGFRFDHESGRHDDRAAVLGMALIYLVPEIPPPTVMPSTQQPFERERIHKGPVPPIRKDWAKARNIMGMDKYGR